MYRLGITGKTHEFEKQYIGTKCHLFLIVPIPICALYHVNKELQIEMAFNKRSLFLTYGVLIPYLIGISSYLFFNPHSVFQLYLPIAGPVFIHFLVRFIDSASVSKKERRRRRIFKEASGYNMCPEYLDLKTQYALFELCLDQYKKKYTEADWLYAIETDQFTNESIYLLYTIASYSQVLAPSERQQRAIDRLDKIFGNR